MGFGCYSIRQASRSSLFIELKYRKALRLTLLVLGLLDAVSVYRYCHLLSNSLINFKSDLQVSRMLERLKNILI